MAKHERIIWFRSQRKTFKCKFYECPSDDANFAKTFHWFLVQNKSTKLDDLTFVRKDILKRKHNFLFNNNLKKKPNIKKGNSRSRDIVNEFRLKASEIVSIQWLFQGSNMQPNYLK